MTPRSPGSSPQQIKLGLIADGIGVQGRSEGNGGPCGLVNGPSQSLELSLAGQLADYEMDYAELDVEGKFGVTVKAQLYLDDVLVRTELLVTGGPDSGRTPATTTTTAGDCRRRARGWWCSTRSC